MRLILDNDELNLDTDPLWRLRFTPLFVDTTSGYRMRSHWVVKTDTIHRPTVESLP